MAHCILAEDISDMLIVRYILISQAVRPHVMLIPELSSLRPLQAMRANIRASQHMWRYNHTVQYIVDRVNSTRGDPQLDVYRPNSTECRAAARHGGGGADSVYSSADGAAIRCPPRAAFVKLGLFVPFGAATDPG